MKKISLNTDNNSISFYYDTPNTMPKACLFILCDLTDIPQNYFNLSESAKNNNLSIVIYHPNDIVNQSDDKSDYFKAFVNNIFTISTYLKGRTKLNKTILMGHGFSAYVAKRCMQISQEFNIAILTGIGFDSQNKIKINKLIISTMMSDKKTSKSGYKIKNLIYNNLEKQFNDKNWLTKNNEYYEKLLKNNEFTKTHIFLYYYSFLINTIKKDKNLENINKNSKILIINGSEDPLIKKKDTFKRFCNCFEYLDIETECKILNNFKHNLFNDDDSITPINIIFNFINKSLKGF